MCAFAAWGWRHLCLWGRSCLGGGVSEMSVAGLSSVFGNVLVSAGMSSMFNTSLPHSARLEGKGAGFSTKVATVQCKRCTRSALPQPRFESGTGQMNCSYLNQDAIFDPKENIYSTAYHLVRPLRLPISHHFAPAARLPFRHHTMLAFADK